MDLLTVEHLTKTYGTGENAVHALDDVSFSVPRGQFLAIIGPSGSGKSTLLHILGGVDRPTSGHVYMNGEDVYSRSDTALAIFRRREVGLIYQFYNLIPVLETGMGGTYDVTNVVEDPLVSVITSISIDHTAFLGSTIAEIAAHKAGIIKRGHPVVYDCSSLEAAAVISAKAEELGVQKFPVTPETAGRGIRTRLAGMEADTAARLDRNLLELSYRGRDVLFEIPFEAPYQFMNAALAIRALDISGLPVTPEQAKAGVRKAKWPARMEQICPGVYLDGAHNEDGIRAFLDAACRLKKLRDPDHVRILFAVSADKKYPEMLAEIRERLQPDFWILAKMESHRTLSVRELEEAAKVLADQECGKKTEILVCPDVKEALNRLFRIHGEHDLTLIAGSLYLAGEVKECFGNSG